VDGKSERKKGINEMIILKSILRNIIEYYELDLIEAAQ
jgi:hypothetical protein